MKKTLSAVLALVMLLTSFAAFSFTADAAEPMEKHIKGVNYEYVIKNDKVTIQYAFISGNSAGKTITIPSKIDGKKVVALECMGMEEKNTKTTTLVIPDTVEKLGGIYEGGGYKTIDCTNLATVKIGKNLKSMSYNPFMSSVKKFTVNSKNKYFTTVKGVLYNKKKTKLVAYPAKKAGKSFTVPASVKTLGTRSFYYVSKLKTLKTNKVVTVADETFYYSGIKTINFGKPLKTITGESFALPSGLKKITVAKGNKYFTVKDNVLFNKKKTKLVYFPYNKKLSKYTVPKSVKTVGRYAFFYNATKKVVVPASVKTVEEGAFMVFQGKVNVPSKVVKIEEEAYLGADVGKSLTLPSTLKTIGKYTFLNADFESVDLSKTKLTQIPEGAFSSCAKLAAVKLPSTLKTIGMSAFTDTAVTSLVLPASVTKVGAYALWCESLKELTVKGADTALNEDAIMQYEDDNAEAGIINTIVIKAPAGSKAETYANEKGFTFEAL